MPSLAEAARERVWQNSESYPLYWWQKLLDTSYQTIVLAARRGGAVIDETSPRFPGQPNQRLIAVADFPKLIAGFQTAGIRPDGHHFHSWSLGVDTTADEFSVTLRGGKTLIFSQKQLVDTT